MRLKGIFAIAIIGTLLSVFSLFFLDNMIKYIIISQGQAINGAKVEIASSKLTLSPLGVQLKQIQIANKENPMENLVQLDTLAMHIQLSALLNKSLIIDDVTATGLQHNTPRKTSGALKKEETAIKEIDDSPTKETSRAQSKETKKTSPESSPKTEKPKINIYDYIDKDALSINKQAEKLKKDIQQAQDKDLKTLSDTTALNAKLNKLNASLDQLEKIDLNNIQKTLTTLKTLNTQVKALKSEISQQKNTITSTINTLKTQSKNLSQATNKDYDMLLNTINFKEVSSSSFSNTLLKGPIETQVAQVLEYYEKAIAILKKINKKEEKPTKEERLTGITVPLDNNNPLPKLWIKNVIISGQNEKTQIKVTLTGISSDPVKLNKATTLSFTVNHASGSQINGIGELDFRGDDPKSNLVVTLANKRLSTEEIPSAKLDGKGVFNVVKTRLDGAMTLTVSQVVLKKGLIKNKLIATVVNSIKETSIRIKLRGQVDDPSISISSDIDDLINRAFKRQAKKEQEKIKTDIKTQLNQIKEQQQTGINAALNSYQDKAAQSLKKQEAQVTKVQENIQKEQENVQKEINAQKKAAEEKVKAELEKQFNKLF